MKMAILVTFAKLVCSMFCSVFLRSQKFSTNPFSFFFFFFFFFFFLGDGVVDIQLIGDLHKSEVFKVGRVVGVPESVLSAPPSADLWDGQTDEEELGFSYDFVELWTTYLGSYSFFFFLIQF